MIERKNGTSIKSIPRRKQIRKRKGADLFGQLVHLTGVSGQTIRRELKDILDRKQLNIHELTLDQLRTVAASYLRQIMHSVLDRQRVKDQSH